MIKYLCIEGTAPASETIVYTIPVGCRSRWHSLSIVNTGASPYWAKVHIRSQDTTSIQVAGATLNAGDTLLMHELPLLPAGSTVRVSGENTDVEYVLSVEEEHEV